MQNNVATELRPHSLPALSRIVHVAVARRLFELALHRMRGVHLRVVLPDQRVIEVGPRHLSGPTMRIVSEDFFLRLATAGKLAFGEAYTARDWQTDALPQVLSAFASNLDRIVPFGLRRIRTLIEDRTKRPNTLHGADENIARHYDLSNEFFALFLDPSMTYSSAVFAPGDTLEQAQRRKYGVVADLAGVTANDHVLEIGTGWGGMAIFLAQRYGCTVTTTTLSREQHDLAVERIAAAGLADHITVLRQDYRTVAGTYSKIVSIEMFEAVGEEYWPVFFATCDRLLEPGGALAMQTITMPDGGMREARRTESWIQKHIFPGGALPSHEALDNVLRRSSSLRVTAAREVGPDYVTTLQMWRRRFRDRLDDVRALGFDETFIRTWDYYLSFCEAGFATGLTGDAQLRLERSVQGGAAR